MAKASRSSKKQPAFDANELADLIFSPAVGSGVGSHLVGDSHSEGNSHTGLVRVSTLTASILPFPAPLSPPPALPQVDAETFKEKHPEGNLTLEVIHIQGRPDELDDSKADGTPSSEDQTHPEGNLPTGLPSSENVTSEPEIESASEEQSHPEGNFPIGPLLSEQELQTADSTEEKPPPVEAGAGKSETKSTHPEGKLPTGISLPPRRQKLQPDLIDGSVVGRQQKIRRAIVAQDGHSSGEQLLYLSLWNAATVETPDTRLLSIGYNGMSSLCKLERSNCKKNVQSLVEKLALEVTKPHQTASSTGTTYRIFSYGEILRRRKAAGLIWVIRTSGVRFVDPTGNSPTPPVGNLPRDPVRESPTGPLGEAHTPPVCKIPTPLGIRSKATESASSSSLIYAALSQFGLVDDDVLRRFAASCYQAAPDCTDEDILHFIQEKGAIVRAGRISNPIGFLLTAVPKCFSGESFQHYRVEKRILFERRAEAEERSKREAEEWRHEQQRLLLDPDVADDHKAMIREWLGLPSEQGAASPDSNINEDSRKG
jgi:hypothetical protein